MQRRLPSLGLPSPDTLPWGAAALASDFEGARELFNSGVRPLEALAVTMIDIAAACLGGALCHCPSCILNNTILPPMLPSSMSILSTEFLP